MNTIVLGKKKSGGWEGVRASTRVSSVPHEKYCSLGTVFEFSNGLLACCMSRP